MSAGQDRQGTQAPRLRRGDRRGRPEPGHLQAADAGRSDLVLPDRLVPDRGILDLGLRPPNSVRIPRRFAAPTRVARAVLFSVSQFVAC